MNTRSHYRPKNGASRLNYAVSRARRVGRVLSEEAADLFTGDMQMRAFKEVRISVLKGLQPSWEKLHENAYAQCIQKIFILADRYTSFLVTHKVSLKNIDK